jgi:hypothetical protein
MNSLISAAALSPAASTTTLEVIALFPNCSSCGEPLSPLEGVELDPSRPQRARHTRCRSASSSTAVHAT